MASLSGLQAVVQGALSRFWRVCADCGRHRTRVKSPGQNGVRERAFKSLKYEHLYRHEIDDGHQLGLEAESYRQLFNTVRPHQTLAGRRPLDVHLEACQTRQTPKLSEPETLPLS